MKMPVCLFTLVIPLTLCACTSLSSPARTPPPSSTLTKTISIPSLTATNNPSTPTEHTPTLGERFSTWLSAPFTGVASIPFTIAINEGDGTRGLVINETETKAYIVGEFLGQLHQVDIDPTSSTFGKTILLAEKLFILNDLAVNKAETWAYVTRESGPGLTPVGRNEITRFDLATSQGITVTAAINQPSNIALSQDETTAYVVDLHSCEIGLGGLYRVDLETGSITPIVTGLDRPFAVAVNQAQTVAYVVTEPARAGEYPAGNLLLVDIPTGKVTNLVIKFIYGASGITLIADETLAVVTEFGHEIGCDGKVSVININPASSKFGEKTELVTALCGAHDVRLNKAETLAYFVEVGNSKLSAIKIDFGSLR
jgi:DNA-binding beta-propeller fold protein YncE